MSVIHTLISALCSRRSYTVSLLPPLWDSAEESLQHSRIRRRLRLQSRSLGQPPQSQPHTICQKIRSVSRWVWAKVSSSSSAIKNVKIVENYSLQVYLYQESCTISHRNIKISRNLLLHQHNMDDEVNYYEELSRALLTAVLTVHHYSRQPDTCPQVSSCASKEPMESHWWLQCYQKAVRPGGLLSNQWLPVDGRGDSTNRSALMCMFSTRFCRPKAYKTLVKHTSNDIVLVRLPSQQDNTFQCRCCVSGTAIVRSYKPASPSEAFGGLHFPGR